MKKIDYKKSLVAALCLPLLGGAVNSIAASSEPLLGSIDYVGFNFAPRGWASCNGQLLSVSSNPALYSLFGTFYGGDGISTFGLPDMRGRVPVHMGTGPGLSTYAIGQRGGMESIRLTTDQLPSHTHSATATSKLQAGSGDATVANAAGSSLQSPSRSGTPIYNAAAPTVAMKDNSVTTQVQVQEAGSGNPIENRQPYTVLNCIVATVGIFPSRN